MDTCLPKRDGEVGTGGEEGNRISPFFQVSNIVLCMS